MEDALAEYARLNESDFELKSFFDQLNDVGSIPISLGKWEMTGIEDDIQMMTK